jgi:hypothetical protein
LGGRPPKVHLASSALQSVLTKRKRSAFLVIHGRGALQLQAEAVPSLAESCTSQLNRIVTDTVWNFFLLVLMRERRETKNIHCCL